MPSPPKISARESVWVELDGVQSTKIRLCVVMKADDPDYLFVVYGQSSGGSEAHVRFESGKPESRMLGAKQDTYFRQTNFEYVKRHKVRSVAGKCIGKRFIELEKLGQAAQLAGKIVIPVTMLKNPVPFVPPPEESSES